MLGFSSLVLNGALDTGEWHPFSIPRLDALALSPTQFRQQWDRSGPAIVTGLFSDLDCEGWCDGLLEDVGHISVDFQVRFNDDGHTDIFSSTFLDFVQELQGQSTHAESWYLLEEHILDLPQARPGLKTALDLPEWFLSKDEFDYFPPEVRPQKMCVIVGGLGARSFLHSDPMEWMGWNILIEGRKLWTFLPPSPALDHALGTYRLPPNAFGDHDISAGWQSRVDLYRDMGEGAGAGDLLGPKWPHEGGEGIMRLSSTVVQEAGDVIFIPPRAWHQVYHLEPSIAVASQYMDEAIRDGVFEHILNWTGASKDSLPPSFVDLSVKEKVQEVLKEALMARYGHKKGLEEWAGLGW